jgi:NitT/TauT family transport system substrate-binding protein
MTTGAFGEREGAVFVAQDQGLFRKYQLDVQFVQVRSGPVSMSALAAAESQFHIGAVTGTTLGAVVGGLDVVFVAGLINKLTGTIVVSPKIKSPSDLKGKTIGITSMGGGIWMFTMLAFDHWGLDPKRDKITFRVMGGAEDVLAQSIAAGVIDGSYLGYTFASILERQGFRILADLAKLGIPYQNTGVLARRGFVNASPQVVERLVRALADAVTFVLEPANKTPVMKSLARGLHLSQVEDAAEGYQAMISLYQRRINPTVEGVRNAIKVLGTTNEKLGRLKAEELVDSSIVEKLAHP